MGHLGDEFVMQVSQIPDRGGSISAVVGERCMDARARKLGREKLDLARGSAHNKPHVGLGCLHSLERMYAEEQAGERGHLVGGHQPCADRNQEHQLRDERHEAQAPQWDWVYAPRRGQNQVDGARVECGFCVQPRRLHH
jgi:hypothetical protein